VAGNADHAAAGAAASVVKLAGDADHAAPSASRARLAREADDAAAGARCRPLGAPDRSPGRRLPQLRSAGAAPRDVPRRLLERTAVPSIHVHTAGCSRAARALLSEDRGPPGARQ
jgi:hypothetical protein